MFDLLWSPPAISVDQVYCSIALPVEQVHCSIVRFYPQTHLACKNESPLWFSVAMADAVRLATSAFHRLFLNFYIDFLLPCRQLGQRFSHEGVKWARRHVFLVSLLPVGVAVCPLQLALQSVLFFSATLGGCVFSAISEAMWLSVFVARTFWAHNHGPSLRLRKVNAPAI